jgi:hypothetical protein
MAMTIDQFRQRMRALVSEYCAGQAEPTAPEGVCLATAIEDAAMAVGDEMTQELMSLQLTAVAGEQQLCPVCGQRFLCKGERKRTLQSRRGEVEFTEPEMYCKKCRKAFFPSVGCFGDRG